VCVCVRMYVSMHVCMYMWLYIATLIYAFSISAHFLHWSGKLSSIQLSVINANLFL